MKQTELDMITNEVQNLRKQFDKHGFVSEDDIQAKSRSIAKSIEKQQGHETKVMAKKLQWQDTVTKFIIAVYTRTHKQLLDELKYAVHVNNDVIGTFVAENMDAFEELEIDFDWNAIPDCVSDYFPIYDSFDAFKKFGHNYEIAVRKTDAGNVFDILVSINGIVGFKFLTIKVSENHVKITKVDMQSYIDLSTKTIYEIIDKAVRRVNTILAFNQSKQVDVMAKVSQYQIKRQLEHLEIEHEKLIQERDELIKKIKKA